MKNSDVINTFKAQMDLGRTPSGRTITEYGKNALEATLSDEKNMVMDAIKCKNCCIIVSGLLCPEGCPNCGGHDLESDITQDDVL